MVAPRTFPNWVGLSISFFNARLIHFFRIFLHPCDITFELLKESISYFGYNPRECFAASSSLANLRDIKKELGSAIQIAAHGDIMQRFFESRRGDATNTIFQNFPTNTDTSTNRSLAFCQSEPVSRWALDLLLRHYEAGKAHATAAFYYSLEGMPEAASLRGQLFERQVFNYLDEIRAGHTFRIRGLTDSDQTWTYRGSIRHITFQESTVFKEIRGAVQDRKPRHLVSFVRDFPAMDSILYNPDDPDAVVTCIQVTMNMDHAIVVRGLQLLQGWFKLGSPLQDLRPTHAKPWRLLFVVPSDMADTFKSQELKGDTPENVWAGKVHQYVLGLEEKTIFKCESVRARRNRYGVEYLSFSTADEFGVLCWFR